MPLGTREDQTRLLRRLLRAGRISLILDDLGDLAIERANEMPQESAESEAWYEIADTLKLNSELVSRLEDP